MIPSVHGIKCKGQKHEVRAAHCFTEHSRLPAQCENHTLHFPLKHSQIPSSFNQREHFKLAVNSSWFYIYALNITLSVSYLLSSHFSFCPRLCTLLLSLPALPVTHTSHSFFMVAESLRSMGKIEYLQINYRNASLSTCISQRQSEDACLDLLKGRSTSSQVLKP